MKRIITLRNCGRRLCLRAIHPKHPILVGATVGMIVVHYVLPEYDVHVACIIGIICLEAA